MKLNFEKKDLYWISSIFVFIIGVSLIFAYNPNYPLNPIAPIVHGHTSDEIGLPNCADGQFLKKTATGWGCGDDLTGSGTGITCRVEIEQSSVETGTVCCHDDEVAVAWASNDDNVHTWYRDSNGLSPPNPGFNPNNPKCIEWANGGATRQVMCCKKT